MQDALYEHYNEGIYYPGNLADAEPAAVRALYISYSFEPVAVAKYENLRYLSYAVSTPEWQEIQALKNLDHFGWSQRAAVQPFSLLAILRASGPGLRELVIDQVENIKASEGSDSVLGDTEQFRHFPNLTWLRLNETPLAEFPLALCHCTELDTLLLMATGLRAVAPALGQLQRLKTLSLCRNQLDSFPAGIAALKSLTHLDLSHNPIGEVPGFVAQLTALRELKLSHCGLKTLPAFLADLPHLKLLEVKGNPFVTLPEDLKRLKNKVKIEPRCKALYDEEARRKLEQGGLEPALFTDFGFKLMVVQQLMYESELLTPKFDVVAFAQGHTQRQIDLEGAEAYALIPEVKAYFEQLPVPKILLDEIEALYPDGGDEIYSQLSPQWCGEEGYFMVHSGKDARLLPSLKRVSSLFLSAKARAELEKMRVNVVED